MSQLQQNRLSDRTFSLLLLTPALAFVFLIGLYPILRVVWLSLYQQDLDTGLEMRFLGWDNYTRLLQDGQYWQTLQTTFWFTVVSVGIELVLGLGFALLLNESFRGRGLARASVLIPWALPTAVLALAWVWIFNDQFGVFNDLLRRLRLIEQPIAWLGSGPLAFASLVVADVWKTTPFITIILLAGLQTIPRSLYEAAAIDGASGWLAFRTITLPLLVPSILLALLFRAIQTFGIFDLVYVMTGGGPGGATETVSIYSYNTFFRYLDFGYGAAMVVGTFVVMSVLCLIIYWPLSRLRER